MIDFIYDHVSRIANWWMIALLVIANQICVACFAIREVMLKGEKSPDGHFFGYSPEQAHGFFAKIGPEGRKLYAATQLSLDFAFPLAYGLLLATLLVWLYRGERTRWIILLPLLTVLFDLAENISNAHLARSFQQGQPDGFARVASVFTVGKWAGFGACLLAIVVGCLAKISLWLRSSGGS